MLAGCSAMSPPSAPNDRETELNNIVLTLQNSGASVALMIREAKSGKIIFQHNANQRLQPASNMKLVTAAATLASLGPDYHYKTTLWTDGTVQHHTLQGNIYLQGSGAPDLNTSQLQQLARDLAYQGITRITGHLLLDDSIFDATPYATGWEFDDLSNAYSPQITGLNFSALADKDINAVQMQISASKNIGAPGNISILPKIDSITIINHSITSNTTQFKTYRVPFTNQIEITGTIAAQAAEAQLVSVDQPAKIVGTLFSTALHKNGIRISKLTALSKVPPGARLLSSIDSAPLSALIRIMLKKSNNGYAEIFAKTLGVSPSSPSNWPNGIAVINRYLQQEGIDVNGIYQADGSGLSRHNQLSVSTITQLLYKIQTQAWFPLFKQALPVAGENNPVITSTLTNRLKNTPAAGRVQAKTGSMSGISALSGYITSSQGTPLIFSMIVNNAVSTASYLRDQEDKVMLILVNCHDNGQCPAHQ